MEPPSLDDAILSYIKDYCQLSSSVQQKSISKREIQKHYDSIVNEYDTTKKNVKHALKRLVKRNVIVKNGKKKYSYVQPQQKQSSMGVCTIIATNRSSKRKRQPEESSGDNVDVSASTTESTTIKKKYKYICTYEGCNNQVISGGVCIKHGAERRTCSHEGCNNNVENSGVCVKHGAKRRTCSHEGCTKWVIQGGVCLKHGAKKPTCSHEGCNNGAINGFKVCIRHGAKKRPRKQCEYEGCTSGARRLGVCCKHGAPRC